VVARQILDKRPSIRITKLGGKNKTRSDATKDIFQALLRNARSTWVSPPSPRPTVGSIVHVSPFATKTKVAVFPLVLVRMSWTRWRVGVFYFFQQEIEVLTSKTSYEKGQGGSHKARRSTRGGETFSLFRSPERGNARCRNPHQWGVGKGTFDCVVVGEKVGSMVCRGVCVRGQRHMGTYIRNPMTIDLKKRRRGH